MISYSTLTNRQVYNFPITVDLTGNYANTLASCVFGSDPPKPCLTCKFVSACQGHWGKIKLPQVLYRSSCIRDIEDLLPYFCRVCGLSFELSKEDHDAVMSGKQSEIKRLRTYIKNKLSSRCQRCDLSMPRIVYSPYQYAFTQGGSIVPTDEVCRLFSLVPRPYYPLLSHIRCNYEDLFWTDYLPVIPLFTRYDVSIFNNSINRSPLTLVYTDICSLIRNGYYNSIQKKVDSIEIPIDNNGIPFELGRTVHGKKNTFRQMINAYRGDGSTRSVLNCFGTYKLNEILLNDEVYKTMENRVYVTPLNRDILPVALGFFHNNKYYTGPVTTRLAYGDWIETLVKPGDYVLSVRFPSLHQGSIFVAKLVRQVESFSNSRTTKIPTMATAGLNGDQDGDEITTKILFSAYSQFELITLFNPYVNVIHYVNHGPSYSTIQEELMAITKLYNQSMIYPSDVDYLIDRPMTGRETLEYLLGIVIPSMNSKHIVYGSSMSYMSNVYDFYGLPACVESTEMLVRLAKIYMNTNPISIGPKDYFLDVDLWEQIRLRIDKFNVDLKDEITNMVGKNISSRCIPYIIKLTSSRSNKINAEMLSLIKKRMETSKTCLNYPYITKYKVSDNELIDLFVKLRPKFTEPDESYYFGRLLPTMLTDTIDPRNLGLIERGLFYGLTMTDRLHTHLKAREQIIATSCGTAEKGYRTRQLIKRLEDVHINELGFVVSDSVVLNPCINSYKLLSRYLVALKYDHSKTLKNPRAIELRERISNLSDEILCPLDIPSAYLNFKSGKLDKSIRSAKNGKLSYEKINSKVYELSQYVYHSHMLMLGCTDMLEYVVLYYLDSLDVHSDFLDFVIGHIRDKYIRSNMPGVPIGIQAAQSIGEKDTQSSLSSFHSVSKSGRELHEAKNDNYRYYDMKKHISGSTVIRGNMDKLTDMYKTLKYVSMYDLVETVEHIDNRYILVISNLVTYNITFADVILMISEYAPLEILNITLTPLNDHQLQVEFSSNFVSEMDRAVYNQSFLHRMYKGLIINADLIDDSLYLELDSMDILSYFDTSDLQFDIPLEVIGSYFGTTHVYQTLISNYKFSGETHLNSMFDIVSSYQTCHIKPISISKYKRFETSPLKATSVGSGRYLTDAALTKTKQKIRDIPSCIFMSQPIPVGTGFYKTCYDTLSLINAVVKSDVMDNLEVVID
jgi:hypothetical protein